MGKTRRIFGLLLALSMFAAACSSNASTAADSAADSKETNGSENSSSSDETETGESLAAFEDKVAEAWTEATGPIEAFEHEVGPPLAEGASIGAACLGSQITACVQWWNEMEVAADLVGWDVTLYDGQIDVTVWNEQLTRAAEAGHDGIAIFGGIPSLSSEGVAAIEEAGIPLVGMTTDDPEGVSAVASRLDGGIEQDNFEIGYLQGVAAYTLGSGKVHAIGGYDGSEISVAREAGWQAFIDECAEAGGDCWSELRPTDTAEMFTQIETFCPSLAQANPDFNVMVSQVDDITAICIDAIEAAGLLKDGDFGIGVDFNAIGVERISSANNVLRASVAVPYFSGAWQGIDELNRLIAGQAPLDNEGRPWPKRVFFQGNVDLVDTSSDTPWDVQLADPKSYYSESWGLN